MSYYKLGASSPAVNSLYEERMVERARLAGVLDLPEPLPTLILYVLMVFGAIVWIKAGGL